MILTMTEKVLSIFIDESGRFQYPDDKSRFYIISMVMHDQSVDITQEVSNLEQGFRSLHLSNLCFHAGPLIRQEKILILTSSSDICSFGVKTRLSPRARGVEGASAANGLEIYFGDRRQAQMKRKYSCVYSRVAATTR